MKAFKLLLLVAFLAPSTTGLWAQDKKVALATFYVSKHIGFSELGGNAAMAAGIASLMEDPSFNLQPVLDNFYKTFQEEFVPQFPFALLAEEEVQQNPAYLAYQGRFNEAEDVDRNIFMQRFLTADGYKPLQESLFNNEKSNQMQMVEMFKETADGVMFVSMGYEFVKKMVPFTAGIRAFVRIKIWNKEGKKVLTVNEGATSKKSIAVIAGIPVMDPAKLLPLCENASAELMEDLNKRMKKMAKKANKKL
jgi:hypothetical protein